METSQIQRLRSLTVGDRSINRANFMMLSPLPETQEAPIVETAVILGRITHLSSNRRRILG